MDKTDFLIKSRDMSNPSGNRLANLRSAILDAPDNLSLKFELAGLLVQAGNAEEAMHCLADLAQQPLDPSLHLQLANLYRLNNQNQLAMDVLRESLTTTPTDHQAWVLLYHTLVDAAMIDEAQAHLEHWLEIDPGNALATYLLPSLKELPMPERAPPAFVTSSYTSLVANYDRLLTVDHYHGSEVFSKLMTDSLGKPELYRQIDGQRQGVDLGCGTGALGAVLRNYANHIVGVDLSPEMLAVAQQTQCYDQLICADMIDFLRQSTDSMDVIVAAESFNYFGNLTELVSLCLAALKQDGWLIFSLQQGPLAEDGYYLLPNGTFMHSPQYLVEQLGEAGLAGGSIRRVVIREPKNQNVWALLVAVQRPAAN